MRLCVLSKAGFQAPGQGDGMIVRLLATVDAITTVRPPSDESRYTRGCQFGANSEAIAARASFQGKIGYPRT